MAVELGEGADRTDVRGLVENRDDRWFEAAAGGLGEEFGDLQDAVDKGGDNGRRGTSPFFREQVHGRAAPAGAREQIPDVQCGRWFLGGWFAPGIGRRDPTHRCPWW